MRCEYPFSCTPRLTGALFCYILCTLSVFSKTPFTIAEVKADVEIRGDHSAAVSIFLEAASVAMSRLEYTTPLEHNAFQLYQSVLLLDPQNSSAVDGVDMIRVSYVKLLDQAVAENDVQRIRSYYYRAKGVGVAVDVLNLYEDKFEANTEEVSRPASGITLTSTTSNDDAFRLRRIGKAYQGQKDFPRAAKVYEQLIHMNGQDSSDWLGLAVSLDSMGNLNEAAEAYKRVVYFRHSNPKIVTFARQRIEELSTGAEN